MTRIFIEAAAEEAGWNVTIKPINDGWFVSFSTDTHLDQGVNFEYEVKSLDDILDEVKNTYDGYDPDEEAKMWYGHCNHSLSDLIDDMREVDKKLEDLCLTLNGNHVKEPNEVDFTREANDLQDRCLMELMSNIHRGRPSKFGVDAKGFDNPDKCSKYEEIIYLNGRWTLVDGVGLQYSINVMPLEDICRMVDAIINGKEE